MKASFSFFFIFLSGISFSQIDTALIAREKKLAQQLDFLRSATSDLDKESANALFKSSLLETIQLKGAMEYGFANLKSIGTVKSPDNSFRFFNWNVELADETQKYYCYILRYDEKKKSYKVIELVDNSMMLPPQSDELLDEKMWYGALYYKIIPIQKSGKTIYTVLGYDANNNMSHIKLVDVISFSGSHVKLGSPIFKSNGETRKRLFFEHSKKSVMSLNYDADRKKIIFDHLLPESPSMKDFPEYYVPDMSLDALNYDGSKWILEEDIIGINKGKTEKQNPVYVINANKSGELERHKEATKWVDPSNPNAPAGQNIHTAAMPEEVAIQKPKSGKKEKEVSEFPEVTKKNKKKSKSAITGVSSRPKR